MPARLTARTRLVDLRKEAKELWHALEQGDPQARARVVHSLEAEELDDLSLVVCQNVIAREHGFANWNRLKHKLNQLAQPVGGGFAQGELDPGVQSVTPDQPDTLPQVEPDPAASE
jgi:hypothetical protein